MFCKTPVSDRIARAPRRPRHGGRRGATAVLAMLFLVILGSLSIAMYAMATTNVQAARNFSDGDRARATAESGLRWTAWRFNRMQRPKTRIGNISAEVAEGLWPTLRTSIANDYATLANVAERKVTWDPNTETLSSSPIASDETSGRFTISIRQHPLYAGDKLDQKWLRVTSTGRYGNAARALSMDFKIDKKIKFAMVGKVPFQIGRNVLVEGPIGMATPGKYPPILMLSDFRHLDPALTTRANDFQKFLELNHFGYDGRINVNHPQELRRATDAGYSDYSRDGFIDEYDLFLKRFDRDGDRAITKQEFTKLDGKMYDPDLFKAIDSLGAPFPGEDKRLGYGDEIIDNRDAYTKIRGTVSLATTANAWEQHLGTSGDVSQYFQGPISPSQGGQLPVLFGVPGMDILDLNPANFDTTTFRDRTGPTAGTAKKEGSVLTNMIVTAADANGGKAVEKTPFESDSYQATYQRPVFRDMTFKDCRIPKGLNALFQNCTFEGTTFVELTTNVTNSSGSTTTSASEAMAWSKQMLPGKGSFTNTTVLTKENSYGFSRGNNLRFDNCTIKGPIASDNPTAYSHFTNSWEFTNETHFENLADTTATIVAPQTNIELGSFKDTSTPSTLVGVVVAGNLDTRGSSYIDGSIIVTGDGAGNTTQGWFGSSDGSTTVGPDKNGRYGRLNIRYNPHRALPDGINIPIELVADSATYSEYVE